ncbi:MAG: response regulator transcription factor [Lachnospiraceae bacterium]|nr:response regulator transcription factor [Lachnospiraceae bacterium]
MIHIAIVEDEAVERDRIKEYAQRFAQERQLPVQIRTFSDGVGIVSPYEAVYDVIFLDIQMKILDGLKTAEAIRAKDEEVILVFITNMVQYALKGYAVNASNFILKPVTYFAFVQEMRQILKKLAQKKSRSVPLKVEDGMIRLALHDLYYAEMTNRKVLLHTRGGAYTVTGTLLKLEELLDDDRFFRCHSGFLVNMQYLHKIQGTSVLLNPGNVEVPLSRHKKKELETRLIQYLQEQL